MSFESTTYVPLRDIYLKNYYELIVLYLKYQIKLYHFLPLTSSSIDLNSKKITERVFIQKNATLKAKRKKEVVKTAIRSIKTQSMRKFNQQKIWIFIYIPLRYWWRWAFEYEKVFHLFINFCFAVVISEDYRRTQKRKRFSNNNRDVDRACSCTLKWCSCFFFLFIKLLSFLCLCETNRKLIKRRRWRRPFDGRTFWWGDFGEVLRN